MRTRMTGKADHNLRITTERKVMNTTRVRTKSHSHARNLSASQPLSTKTAQGGQISRRLIRWLFKWLCCALPEADRDVIANAVADVVRRYWKSPETFDTHCGVPLEYYLLYAAARRVSGVLQERKRQKSRAQAMAKG